jgi:hypothetical protein
MRQPYLSHQTGSPASSRHGGRGLARRQSSGSIGRAQSMEPAMSAPGGVADAATVIALLDDPAGVLSVLARRGCMTCTVRRDHW